MSRDQQHQHSAKIEILRLTNGAIDYAAYDVRARKERARAFHAAVGSLAKFGRSGLAGIAGMAKHALNWARNCDPAGLQVKRRCPTALGS